MFGEGEARQRRPPSGSPRTREEGQAHVAESAHAPSTKKALLLPAHILRWLPGPVQSVVLAGGVRLVLVVLLLLLNVVGYGAMLVHWRSPRTETRELAPLEPPGWWEHGGAPPGDMDFADPGPNSVSTLSVVLPCANEGEYVERTIRSVYESTPAERLLEIIVVDDGSSPRVDQVVTQEFLKAHNAHILRHDQQRGLIRSKKHGGDAARGDGIVFFDCHVKPMTNWSDPIVEHLNANSKRVVVPEITMLNVETWEEISPLGGGSKCCMTWNADFQWCLQYKGPYIPLMSGGLLALTKFWWNMTGGYDEQMRQWGGENLDQSLRTWLCGGEILVAKGSRVAHMFRESSKPKTQLHYQLGLKEPLRNRLRAAEAWMGPWAEKVRKSPDFDPFRTGGQGVSVGSLANVEYFQKKLQCKGFDWYLRKFSDLYLETAWLPEEVFNFRDEKSQYCLQRDEKGFSMTICDREAATQRFHLANRIDRAEGGCCSGLKVWNQDSCLTLYEMGGDLVSSKCESFGDTPAQRFDLTEAGLLEWQVFDSPKFSVHQAPDGGREYYHIMAGPAVGESVWEKPKPSKACVTPKEKAEPLADGQALAAFRLCSSTSKGAASHGQALVMIDAQADGSFQLKEPTLGFCLGHAVDGNQTVPTRTRCEQAPRWRKDEDPARPQWMKDAGEVRLQSVDLGLCLDASDGVYPFLARCERQLEVMTQSLIFRDRGQLELPSRHAFLHAKCLDMLSASFMDVASANCWDVDISGARWERIWGEVPLETRLWREAEERRRAEEP